MSSPTLIVKVRRANGQRPSSGPGLAPVKAFHKPGRHRTSQGHDSNPAIAKGGFKRTERIRMGISRQFVLHRRRDDHAAKLLLQQMKAADDRQIG